MTQRPAHPASLVRRVARRVYRPLAPSVDQAAIGHVTRMVSRSAQDGAVPPDLQRAILDSFLALYAHDRYEPPSPAVEKAVVEQFMRLYYHGRLVWRDTRYRGIETWKCPMDMWTYQELCHELRPGLIVETGTAYGGSAYFLGDLCDTLGHGEVVTIDIADFPGRPVHPRVTYVSAGSTSPEAIAAVRAKLPVAGPVLVILDSDHSRDHVLAELRLYSEFVTPGSYCVVEDTNVNGHPVFREFGPGPMEALDAFLAESSDFVVDPSREKFLMTFNPRGYLRRIRA